MTAVDATLDLAKWYAQEHVVLCLLPAFFIAGVIAVFVSQGSVLKYFGANAKKWISYTVAAVSGGILAVCSCTILPLFTSIYKRGAGLGPAIAFLYSGPAISILSIILTARILGIEMGIARTVGAVLFSVVIGLAMSFIFRKEEKVKKEEQMNIVPPPEKRPMWQTSFHFFTLVLILVFANWGAPAASDTGLWYGIFTYKWYITGILSLLLCLSLVRILKLRVQWVVLGAVATAISALLANLFIGNAKLVPLVPMIVAITALSVILLFDKRNEENREWAFASWGFAKQIMPLLAIGVVTAGFLLGSTHGNTSIAGIIPNSWIEWAVGGNSLLSNFFASFTGAFMYFATLTEVPIIQGLLASGMGKGPALALLLAGPSLSLPNMLVIRGVLGTRKTVVYVALVIVMATVSGFVFGNFF
ncbi:MAG: permease [Odoribacter sp.]|nr:permease [Odoribacter sp.]